MWLLGELFAQESGNVSAVARRLATERAPLRRRWARVRALGTDAMDVELLRFDDSKAPPSKKRLRALRTYGPIHAAIDRWLVDTALRDASGNVTKAAVRLGVSRRVARRLRDGLDAG